jgi:hypothetical protein
MASESESVIHSIFAFSVMQEFRWFVCVICEAIVDYADFFFQIKLNGLCIKKNEYKADSVVVSVIHH